MTTEADRYGPLPTGCGCVYRIDFIGAGPAPGPYYLGVTNWPRRRWQQHEAEARTRNPRQNTQLQAALRPPQPHGPPAYTVLRVFDTYRQAQEHEHQLIAAAIDHPLEADRIMNRLPRYGPPAPPVAPPANGGQHRCGWCGQMWHAADMTKHAGSANGVGSRCRQCDRIYYAVKYWLRKHIPRQDRNYRFAYHTAKRLAQEHTYTEAAGIARTRQTLAVLWRNWPQEQDKQDRHERQKAAADRIYNAVKTWMFRYVPAADRCYYTARILADHLAVIYTEDEAARLTAYPQRQDIWDIYHRTLKGHRQS